MLRFVNVCLVLGLVALAYVIYQVKYEARAFGEDIAALKEQLEVERDTIAVLRAEWSLLNRPERIERLAKKYLKLAPADPRQLVTVDTVKERDFQRGRVEVAAPAVTAPRPAKPAAKPSSVVAANPSPQAPDVLPWAAVTVRTPSEANPQ